MEPYVLDETPDVLSIGMRCVEHGWSFWWPPKSVHPILTPPTGEEIVLSVHGNIPCILEGEEPCAAAAPAKVTLLTRSRPFESESLSGPSVRGGTEEAPSILRSHVTTKI